MSAKRPFTLKIPFHWLKYTQPLHKILSMDPRFSTSPPSYELACHFAFRNDEKRFAKQILRNKKNLWLWRTNQQRFCGDFILIDMSSPHPAQRPVFVLDLKQGASLKAGGGGAGIQFKNAGDAVTELATLHKVIPPDTPHLRLSGDRLAILDYFGLDTPYLS